MLRPFPSTPEFYGEHVTVGTELKSLELSSSHLQEQLPEVTSVLKRVPGGSQAVLVRCDDGKLYILKLNENPQGPNVLANEWIGARILQHLNFSVPPFRCISLSNSVIRRFPSLRFNPGPGGNAEPSAGLHFGSEFLKSPDYTLRDDLANHFEHLALNSREFAGIYLFDLWANHQDSRQFIYRQHLRTRAYQAFFIDNGHLFGGPSRWIFQEGPQLFRPPRGVIVAHQHIREWITLFQRDVPAVLCDAVKTVPKSWYNGDLKALRTILLYRLLIFETLVKLE